VAGFEFEEDVFAAPANTGDESVAKLAIKRGPRYARRDSLKVQFGGKDAPSRYDLRQGSDDVFYFGQFRHKGILNHKGTKAQID
jgi:hypothetical protein